MAQRPNIAMLIVRAKFTGILSDSERSLRDFYQIQLSVDGCWEMQMWLYQKLIEICEKLGFWQNTLKFISPWSYICNFMIQRRSGTLRI